MTDASMLDAGVLDRPPTAEAPILPLRPRGRAVSAAQSIILPTVAPGQLWWIELMSTSPQFVPLEYRALQTANVVVYDRELAEIVARFLPLGGYAEPAAASDGASDTALERCLCFARDGWSVVRLVDHGQQQMAKIRRLPKRLLAPNGLADLPVSIFANSGDARYEMTEVGLDDFGQFIDRRAYERPRSLTIVLGPIGDGTAPRVSIASSNGLAG